MGHHSWMPELSQASVIPTTQVQQCLLVIPLGVLLDGVVEGLAVLSFEFTPDFPHVHFTVGDHDSEKDSPCPSWSHTVGQQNTGGCSGYNGPVSKKHFPGLP